MKTTLKAMKGKNTRSSKRDGAALEPVRFEFNDPGASTVCVAGTFNGWQPEATPMIPWGNGRWLTELLLPPGTHEYCLVVDGKWIVDSLAQEVVLGLFGRLKSYFAGEPVRLKGPRPCPGALTGGAKAVDGKTQIKL